MRSRRWRWLHGDAGFALVVVVFVTVGFALFITLDPRYRWSRLIQRSDASNAMPYAAARPTPTATHGPTHAAPTAQKTLAASSRSLRPDPDAPGIDATYTPKPDGSFDVTERITQTGAGGSVELTPPKPRDAGSAGSAFSATHPRVSNLRLTTGAERVLTSVPTLLTHRMTLPMLTGGRSTSLVLTYRLSGTSIQGKAWLIPITMSSDPSLPAVVRVAGHLPLDATSGAVVVSLDTGR